MACRREVKGGDGREGRREKKFCHHNGFSKASTEYGVRVERNRCCGVLDPVSVRRGWCGASRARSSTNALVADVEPC